MKKVLCILSIFFLMTGCSIGPIEDLDNTPTKKVEAYLNSYQSLDDNIINDLDNILDEEITFDEQQREKYRDIVKKGYQELSYEIKDEKINGDSATVEVEIEVIDQSKVMSEANDYLEKHKDEFNDEEGNYDTSMFTDYRLNMLEKNKSKVKYTLNLKLSKTDGKWKLDKLSENDINKINGTYNY